MDSESFYVDTNSLVEVRVGSVHKTRHQSRLVVNSLPKECFTTIITRKRYMATAGSRKLHQTKQLLHIGGF